jgi:dipeptidyl aminopeptidase/acylaminoacyl peptidase
MLAASPLGRVDSLVAPTLIMVGASDRRVPPAQGLALYRALRARGRTARLLVYPAEEHPLSGVAAAADCFVNLVVWFRRHLDIC